MNRSAAKVPHRDSGCQVFCGIFLNIFWGAKIRLAQK